MLVELGMNDGEWLQGRHRGGEVAGGTWQAWSLRRMVEHPAMSKMLLEQGLGVVSKQMHAGIVAGLGVQRGWLTPCPPQKADKAVPETKVSQEELQHAIVQLSKMMQDLLQRMSLLDQDRQKALEKILSEMDSKVAMSPREGGGHRGMHQAREHIPVWGG